jgi:hypothetical protein
MSLAWLFVVSRLIIGQRGDSLFCDSEDIVVNGEQRKRGGERAQRRRKVQSGKKMVALGSPRCGDYGKWFEPF